MSILEFIGVVVAVVGGMKAVDYLFEKITNYYNKSQKIESNTVNLQEYKEQTDRRLAELESQIKDTNDSLTESLKTLESSISKILNDHKEEYLKRINDLDASIIQMKALYQQTAAVTEIKIENLEKAQNKHNNLIERMYGVEKKLGIQEESIKVANHRIDDLEKLNQK